jgi:hypothetical protein
MGSVGGDRRETLSTIPSSAASLIGEALHLFGLGATYLPSDLLGPLAVRSEGVLGRFAGYWRHALNACMV